MTTRLTWLSAGTITDADGKRLRRGETGPFDDKRAQTLHRLGLGRIVTDTDDEQEVIQSTGADAGVDGKAEADTDTRAEASDGTD